MLYPFSLTLDLYIQAESFEEAKKLAEAYVQDASLDTTVCFQSGYRLF